MGLTAKTLLSWTPADLAGLGDTLVTKRKTLIDLNDEILAAEPPETWSDEAATAARTNHSDLSTRLADMVAEVSQVTTEVDEAEISLTKAKADLESALGTARSRGMTVNLTTGTVNPPEGDTDVTQGEVDEIAALISDALTDADNADTALSAVLTRAHNSSYDGGDGSLADAALPAHMRDMTDAELVQYALDHPDQVDNFISAYPERVRQDLGDKLGEMGTDIADNGSDDYPAYVDLLEAYGDDEVVATSQLETMGPENFIDLSGRIIGADTDDSTKSDLQKALGNVLANGTRGTAATDDTGSPSHVSSDWIDALLERGEERIPIPGMDSDGGKHTYIRGYQLLGPLLGTGDHGEGFLDRVGDGMYEFEREWVKEHGNTPWGQVTQAIDGPGAGTRAGYIPNPPLDIDFTDGSGTDKPLGHDPMAGLMEALTRNPEAAREFFAPSDHDDSNGLERVDYLLTDRDWPQGFAVDMEADDYRHEFPSSMSTLGDALEAATTVDANDRSVLIVESIVDETYTDFTSEGKQGKFSEENTLDPSVREQLSRVLGRYMPSVHTALGSDPSAGDLTPGYVFDDARFNTGGEDGGNATRFVLAELAKDAEGREILRGMSNATALDALNGRLHGVDTPGSAETDIDPVARVNGEVLGSIDFGASTEIAQDNLSKDEAYNARIDGYVDLGTAVLGELDPGKVPLTGYLTDQVAEAIKEGLHQDSTGETNLLTSRLFEGSHEANAHLVRDAYWHNMPAEAYPEGMGPKTNLDDLTPEQQRKYSEWLTTSDWGQRLDTEMGRAGDSTDDGRERAKSRLENY
ncbi:hypothetical protein BJ980_002591 [Nocardioides daedukensis]|uniref:DUF6571 domain-containing protein n=1 Tax=Nocardioides daedukensis TaxID=634462 RepID=A0A7Y9UPJ2_9ACTN|nr:DUF6571 family protein [Nocardioides daedukensis]NYG59668.1 hypothetical protein [Nocardioides daedukensis]